MMITGMNMRFINSDSRQWRRLEQLLSTDGIGGIHIWYGEAGSSLTMMNRMQKLVKVPIMFDADLEKGLGQRFPGGTQLPPFMALAASGDPRNAYLAGRITALEGRAVGIQLNLGPVVDVNNNPANPIINVRSFGEDPARVNEFAGAYMRGMRDHNMAACAKHFPGHGDTETDSHSFLATIPSDSTRLWEVELAPFAAAVDAGVDMVMVAHLQAPDYQPHAGTPATLSSFWLQGILRGRLGFNGVIITDAMSLGGISQNYSRTYALIAAINAGCDLIILDGPPQDAIDVVEQAVEDGLISPGRIDEGALRVLRLKARLGLPRQRYITVEETSRNLGRAEYRETARVLAAQGITLLKNERRQVPLRETSETDTLVIIDLYDYPFNHSTSLVTRRIMKTGLPVKTYQLDESDDEAVYALVTDSIAAGARVLVNTFVSIAVSKDRIFLPDKQLAFVRGLLAKTDRLVIASLGSPYLIQAFPEAPAYICAFNSSALMQSALADALLGYRPVGGRMPVSVPGVAELGAGLDLPLDSLVMVELAADSLLVDGTAVPPPHDVTLRRVMPFEVAAVTDPVTRLVREAVADSAWPGGVLLAAKGGKVFIHEAFGYHTYPRNEPTRRGDIFDLASLTKTVGTTSAIMKLYHDGRLELDEKVVHYLPEFRGPTPTQSRLKAQVTIRHLLTHSAGLPPFRQFFLMEGTIASRLDSVYATPLDTVPGAATIYSDIGFITLGKIVERLTGLSLDVYLDSVIFKPLGMNSTYFNPPGERLARIVPTEYSQLDSNLLVHGYVHDENAWSLGGVAGHAGLFSTAADLAILAQMMLNGGVYRDSLIFGPETVARFTQRAEVIPGSSRCLGWDSPAGEASAGVYASSSSFGHTGFTGTSLWMDPENRLFVILLTNAVHPYRSWKHPKYYDWRQRIHSAVYQALPDQQRNPDLKLKDRWQ
ncbi:MAG: serine hydrolase [Candidatus Marinimicrobia bacterium]|nr:serine hydrolase [Candidatus Neomarinimicrobiota bacterium]